MNFYDRDIDGYISGAPNPYNYVNSPWGRMAGGMIGGVVIIREPDEEDGEEGVITGIREYNPDEKKQFLLNNDFYNDAEDIEKHINYLSSDEVKEYIENLPEEQQKKVKNMIVDDISYLYDIMDKGLNMSLNLSNIDDILKDDGTLNLDRPIKEDDKDELILILQDNIEKNREKIVELRQLSLNYPALKVFNENQIANHNLAIEQYNNEIKRLKDEARTDIKPVFSSLRDIAPNRELPERYKYTDKNLLNFINKLNTQLENENIKNYDFGITGKIYKETIVPKGGAKAFEKVMEDNKKVQKAVYDELGYDLVVPDLQNLQNYAGKSDSLPIDMIDKKNKILMELKKYVNYDYNELINDMYNSQIVYLQNNILSDINGIFKKKDLTNYDRQDIMNLAEKITNEKGDLDRKKTIKYINDNYGSVGIPIGVKKFGNTGEFDPNNKLNNINTERYVNSQKNKLWDIEIDYDMDSPTYGKIIALHKVNEEDVNYAKKPKDYIFTIATNNELLTFNYSKYIRDNKITSPLNVFKVGDDYYNTVSEGVSYFIPINLFEKVDKTKIIEPDINENNVFELLKDTKTKLPQRINDILVPIRSSQDYIDFNQKKMQRTMKMFQVSKLLKDVDIVNEKNPLKKKGELEKKLKEIYPINKKIFKNIDAPKNREIINKKLDEYRTLVNEIDTMNIEQTEIKNKIFDEFNKQLNK